MHAQLASAMDRELRDVVRHVVDLVHPLGDLRSEDPRHRLAHAMRQHRPVAPGKVRRARHRSQVPPPLRGAQRRARQLTIGQRDPVAGLDRVYRAPVVRAHLMAEPA